MFRDSFTKVQTYKMSDSTSMFRNLQLNREENCHLSQVTNSASSRRVEMELNSKNVYDLTFSDAHLSVSKYQNSDSSYSFCSISIHRDDTIYRLAQAAGKKLGKLTKYCLSLRTYNSRYILLPVPTVYTYKFFVCRRGRCVQ